MKPWQNGPITIDPQIAKVHVFSVILLMLNDDGYTSCAGVLIKRLTKL